MRVCLQLGGKKYELIFCLPHATSTLKINLYSLLWPIWFYDYKFPVCFFRTCVMLDVTCAALIPFLWDFSHKLVVSACRLCRSFHCFRNNEWVNSIVDANDKGLGKGKREWISMKQDFIHTITISTNDSSGLWIQTIMIFLSIF